MSEGNQPYIAVSSAIPITSPPDYHRAWSIYRRRRTLALALLFGWIPFSWAAFLLSRMSLHMPGLVIFLMILWWAAMCWSIWYAGEFRCPRCRRRFGAVGSKKGLTVLWRGLFDPICYNCKLRKFENG